MLALSAPEYNKLLLKLSTTGDVGKLPDGWLIGPTGGTVPMWFIQTHCLAAEDKIRDFMKFVTDHIPNMTGQLYDGNLIRFDVSCPADMKPWNRDL